MTRSIIVRQLAISFSYSCLLHDEHKKQTGLQTSLCTIYKIVNTFKQINCTIFNIKMTQSLNENYKCLITSAEGGGNVFTLVCLSDRRIY